MIHSHTVMCEIWLDVTKYFTEWISESETFRLSLETDFWASKNHH